MQLQNVWDRCRSSVALSVMNNNRWLSLIKDWHYFRLSSCCNVSLMQVGEQSWTSNVETDAGLNLPYQLWTILIKDWHYFRFWSCMIALHLHQWNFATWTQNKSHKIVILTQWKIWKKEKSSDVPNFLIC